MARGRCAEWQSRTSVSRAPGQRPAQEILAGRAPAKRLSVPEGFSNTNDAGDQLLTASHVKDAENRLKSNTSMMDLVVSVAPDQIEEAFNRLPEKAT